MSTLLLPEQCSHREQYNILLWTSLVEAEAFSSPVVEAELEKYGRRFVGQVEKCFAVAHEPTTVEVIWTLLIWIFLAFARLAFVAARSLGLPLLPRR